MSDFTVILLVVVVLLLAAVVAVLLWRARQSAGAQENGALQMLQQQLAASAGRQDQLIGQLNQQLTTSLGNLTKTLNEQLNQGHQLSQQAQRLISDRLENAGKTIGEVKLQLGELGQATRNIIAVGGEVRKLQDILQRPKLRGSLGEWTLENLLAEVLPQAHYELQHHFKNGTIVDALVRLAQGSVCIDAKFPLANFQAMLDAPDDNTRQRQRRAFLKDVCRRIDEISEKYILPDEGTLDFALMYVPAENVYYEATMSTADAGADVCAYGRQHKVVPVSPNMLYAYLMVIATGLKGLQIEKNAQVIRRQLTQLAGDIEPLITDFALVGKHLSNAHVKHNDATQKLGQLQLRLQQLETEAEEETDSNQEQ